MNEPEADLTDRRRPTGIDPGTKLLAMFAGGIGTLLVVVVGGWSLLGHHQGGGGIPVVEPPPGPVRVKPVDPGGMQLMGGQALSASNGSAAQGLAPGPEAPAPEALQQEVDAARQADAPPKPAAVAQPARAPAQAPAATQAAPAAGQAAPHAAAPVSMPAPAPPAAPPASDVPDRSTATVAPATDDAAPAAVPATHGPEVQLAALDTGAAAQAEWSRLTHQAPGLFANRHPAIVRASRDGRQFFRLRTGGFANLAEATAFCSHARQAGLACTLADF